MGLLSFLRRLLFGNPPLREGPARQDAQRQPQAVHLPGAPDPPQSLGSRHWTGSRLPQLQHQSTLVRTPHHRERGHSSTPYAFASIDWTGKYLDLSTDADLRWLEYYGLPVLRTPQQLAEWLELPLGKLAWLAGRFWGTRRPPSVEQAHYHFRWIRKRSGGHRLIEAPKQELRRVQQMILRKILDRVAPHSQAHGFVRGRSILTNARPHVGRKIVVKFDLENFYPSVSFSRVVAIYRSLGFSREVALWLARLTTSSVPWSMPPPGLGWEALVPYLGRHLPQGAPTSPALANLSAYGLDVRLDGLARRYGLTYTRYADDLTFSGPGRFVPALREFLPLATRIIRAERFRMHCKKRHVLRRNQRQVVTGVVVNDRPGVPRAEYDRLKAILHHCIQQGPKGQNREGHADFAAHLRGRIAHVRHLNPDKGARLLALYARIDWAR